MKTIQEHQYTVADISWIGIRASEETSRVRLSGQNSIEFIEQRNKSHLD